MPIFSLYDTVEENGKTIRQNNRAIPHTIPLGTLVEVKYDDWFGNGACERVHARLWVVKHCRDCDGSPLYCLSRWTEWSAARDYGFVGGITEKQLTVIPLTPELIEGHGALEWEEDNG